MQRDATQVKILQKENERLQWEVDVQTDLVRMLQQVCLACTLSGVCARGAHRIGSCMLQQLRSKDCTQCSAHNAHSMCIALHLLMKVE